MIIGITTAPRPTPTVVQSIKSLREDAGYTGGVVVFDDGCGQKFPADIEHFINVPQLGSLPNFFRALGCLIDMRESTVVLLEDDILWANGAWEVLLYEFSRLKHPCLYSVHASWTVSKPLEERMGMQRLPYGIYDMTFHGKAGGSNAYIMDRHTAKKLWLNKDLRELLKRFAGMSLEEINIQSRRDNRITKALVKMRIPIYFRIPSLCNHSMGKLNSSEYNKTREWETRYYEDQAVPVVR